MSNRPNSRPPQKQQGISTMARLMMYTAGLSCVLAAGPIMYAMTNASNLASFAVAASMAIIGTTTIAAASTAPDKTAPEKGE